MADRIGMPPETPPETSSSSPPTLTSLVGGIVEDLQRLIRQELQLAKSEVQQEWEKTKLAATSMAAGTAFLGLGGVLLCFMFVYLLDAYVQSIPLWGWFGIVAAILMLFGGLLLGIGRAKVSQINVIPPQTAETLKELTEPR